MKTNITAVRRRQLADLQTPVSIYLKVRDMFPQSALLESSDYHSSENSFSFIGIEPIARFSVRDGRATQEYPDGEFEIKDVTPENPVEEVFNDFIHSFNVTGETSGDNGFFGYTAYDAVRYFENIDVSGSGNPGTESPPVTSGVNGSAPSSQPAGPAGKPAGIPASGPGMVSGTDKELAGIPEITYILYRFVIAVNHLRNEMNITENIPEGGISKMDELISTISSRNFPDYGFKTRGEVSSPITDKQYTDTVSRGIAHCLRGDVFQIVLSRRFQQQYIGDDFTVYRALRSINPSPYLFYFDFGSYRIFGSSPETHLKVKRNVATIDPIAGTFHRTGDDEKDQALAQELLADPKENAEHVMLVDLARNDLSRNASNVRVKSYKEIQFYSHVIHMVSRVSGDVSPETNRIKLFADTFPAGTLSGAPKVRAMQLINEIEKHPRGIYGGCIGHIGFDGDLNQAITIRTFVSRNNTLYFQAGAGIVAKSNPENELKEVNNKLGALHKAIEIANELK